ncbi:putative transporter [Vairimorpha necatrix]|uniref:Transporter n=1 Tax=Vairimorpha necatrix TaxID=6039 RepID=A0AAX4JGC2_9MICR
MKDLEIFFSVLFCVSPIVGFIPQILTQKIIFPELLSSLTIIANILKIFHFREKSSLSSVIPLQGIFTIILHSCLLYFNKSLYSVTEEKIMKKLKITNKQLYFSYILLVAVSTHLIGSFIRSFEFCGLLSLIFEVSVNSIQLLIEKQNKEVIIETTKKVRSQKELYLVWIVGDICRIFFMISVDTPYVYSVASLIQLGIDGYLLYK